MALYAMLFIFIILFYFICLAFQTNPNLPACGRQQVIIIPGHDYVIHSLRLIHRNRFPASNVTAFKLEELK